MPFDAHKNFALSLVATAPSPDISGTSLIVTASDGDKFPAPPFNATVWPAAVPPIAANAEIVRVTNITTDTFTIARAQESSYARSIQIGDQIAATITAKTLTDVEDAVSLIQVQALAITAPTTISITEVDGEILFLQITQDETGHAVSWDTMFRYPPAVPSAANLVTTALFAGIAGQWVNTGIIGRHT